MRIGSVGVHFQPYIYNTNTVSANSLNKISGIEEDALKSSVAYSNDKNENPLKPGETSNFMDVLTMQFQLGRNNAARVMVPVEAGDETANLETESLTMEMVENSVAGDATTTVEQMGDVLDPVEDSTQDASESFRSVLEKLEISTQESASQINAIKESDTSDYNNSNTGNNGNLFMMNKAIEAYTAALAV